MRNCGQGLRLVWFVVIVISAGYGRAAAQSSIVSQVNLGVLAHNVPILGEQKEHGVDLNGELLFVSPVPDRWVSDVAPKWRWLLQPRPTLGFDANTNGYTSWNLTFRSLGRWTGHRWNPWPDHAVFLV